MLSRLFKKKKEDLIDKIINNLSKLDERKKSDQFTKIVINSIIGIYEKGQSSHNSTIKKYTSDYFIYEMAMFTLFSLDLWLFEKENANRTLYMKSLISNLENIFKDHFKDESLGQVTANRFEIYANVFQQNEGSRIKLELYNTFFELNFRSNQAEKIDKFKEPYLAKTARQHYLELVELNNELTKWLNETLGELRNEIEKV